MKFKKQIVRRDIAGQPMLIPVGDMTKEYNGIFTLSATGNAIIDAIEDGLDENGIVCKILDEFEIDEETAKNDVSDFLKELRNFGLID